MHSYVPGDSDHHPCMMQSTIRGELTRLLRTNSSVDSFEQEVKLFRLSGPGEITTAKSSIESPRVSRGSPRKRWLEARRKSSRSPLCTKVQHSRSLRHFPFRRVINKHVKVVQRFWGRECKPIVARTVAPNLLTRMSSVAWPHGRRTSQGLNVCYSFVFWICPESDVDSLHHPIISCHQHLSEDFCSRRVEFQRNASTKKLPPSYGACHLHGSLSVSYFLVESADQIRRASQKTERFPVSGFHFHTEPYFAMNPRYQDGSFQTAADMLRNQHREFVEPLM